MIARSGKEQISLSFYRYYSIEFHEMQWGRKNIIYHFTTGEMTAFSLYIFIEYLIDYCNSGLLSFVKANGRAQSPAGSILSVMYSLNQ